ncbi:MAG: SCO family protein [Phycisphaerales bacterium]|nr:SCO family protein [Phycisphaerales bacterium]
MTRLPGTIRSMFATAIAATSLITCASSANAQVLADELPAEFEGVGIVQRLDESVPLDLTFTDSNGKTLQLKDLFREDRPVILTLNYYRCPMLCSLTLNGMVDGLREMDWSAGDEFDIITVSINPEEGPELAAQNKAGYLTSYGNDGAESGWHFLVGEQDQIETLAKTVGFGYRFDEESGEYAHTSSIIFLTPDGRISKYMNDVRFNPRDLRFALVEASEGGIGSPMDTMLLFNCFQWDPERGAYVANAWKIMRLGGVLTVIILVIGILVLSAKGPRGKGPGGDQIENGPARWDSGQPVGGKA